MDITENGQDLDCLDNQSQASSATSSIASSVATIVNEDQELQNEDFLEVGRTLGSDFISQVGAFSRQNGFTLFNSLRLTNSFSHCKKTRMLIRYLKILT